MMRALYFLLILLLVACENKNLHQAFLDVYKENSIQQKKDDTLFFQYKEYVGIYLNESTIFGKLLNQPYGHSLTFLPSGQLSEYEYLVGKGRINSYYLEQTKDGCYTEKGSPLVDIWTDESHTPPDSVSYLMLFSKFPRTKVEFLYSLDSIDYKKVELKNSELMPLMAEVRLTLPSYVKKIYAHIVASEIFWQLSCVKDQKDFYSLEILP